MAIAKGIPVVLVFGGTGFIGRHLCQRLQAAGVAARIVSRRPDAEFLARYAPGLEALPLERFRQDPAAHLGQAETVIYLASQSTPAQNIGEPWREFADNVEPALQLASQMAEHGAGRLIYLSSGGAVYGHPETLPVPEQQPLRPVSPYGLGKQMVEVSLAYLARIAGLRHCVLRPSNPIGYWQRGRKHGVVGTLLRAALQGERFTMIGDGSHIRDYMAVEDLVQAIELAAAAPQADGQVWNVGSGRGLSTRQVHDIVCAVTGREIPVDHAPDRPSDVRRVVLDTARIRADLGWQARIGFEQQVQMLWQQMQAEAGQGAD